MWLCDYCGNSNEDHWTHCAGCGQDALDVRVVPVPQARKPTPLRLVAEDNPSILHPSLPGDSGSAREWLNSVQNEIGGGYRISESHTALLLSDQGESQGKEWLKFCDENIRTIRRGLGLKNPGGERKVVVILFTDADDYYYHISHFYSDGEHPQTSGLCIAMENFDHVVMPCHDASSVRPVLAHELTHACISHLPLPTWLNEHLALTFERIVSMRGFLLDRETADRHYVHWRTANIQRFWTGEAFHIPSENEMAYGLAEILGSILKERGGEQEFRNFIQHAHYDDAGQTAALNYIGLSLDEVLEGFLGEGNWAPSPEIISDYYNRKEK